LIPPASSTLYRVNQSLRRWKRQYQNQYCLFTNRCEAAWSNNEAFYFHPLLPRIQDLSEYISFSFDPEFNLVFNLEASLRYYQPTQARQ
jgi:competence CoiA-like predicted nuclease